MQTFTYYVLRLPKIFGLFARVREVLLDYVRTASFHGYEGRCIRREIPMTRPLCGPIYPHNIATDAWGNWSKLRARPARFLDAVPDPARHCSPTTAQCDMA